MKVQKRRIPLWLAAVALSIPLTILISSFACGAFLRNVPQTLVQPNGEVLKCFCSGDERYRWLHDADGYVIVRDPKTGFYTYAFETGGKLLPSRYVAGKVNPAAVGLKRGVMPNLRGMRKPYALFMPSRIRPVRPAPSTGTINNIVIFIRFSDENEFTDKISTYDNMFNLTAPLANSMSNYYTEVSYNKLSVSTTFYPPAEETVVSYQDYNPRAYYQPKSESNPIGYTDPYEDDGLDMATREHILLKSAINTVKRYIPSDLVVDSDGDGYVDNVCFIVYGSPGAWSDLLWPHMWTFTPEFDGVTPPEINGKTVGTYNFQLQSYLLESEGVGVLCHEMNHSLGMPDLYHYEFDGLYPVWLWDIMEYNTDPPQHMGAYMKWRYTRWIEEIPEIVQAGTYSIRPITSPTNNCYKISSPYSDTQYFVVEYRNNNRPTFESMLPGSGLLVYRINTECDGMGNAFGPPDEVYIYRPGGTIEENGNPDDATFSLEEGRIQIDDTTDPSSFLADGSPGGLKISNIGSAGSTISFTVRFGKVETPVIIPNGGTYSTPQNVTITCGTAGATIRYTTDGTDPTLTNGKVYESPIVVDRTLTLKAKAWKGNYEPSEISSAYFVIRQPTIFRVKYNAPGEVHDGTTWEKAFLTINDALSKCIDGDQVWVAAGTYQERLTIRAGIKLYGGFAGTEVSLAQRKPSTNITIIDGGKEGSVVTFLPGVGESGRIDGFTIRNGSSTVGGGGIFCYYASPVIANNVITGNTSSYGGGGIHCQYRSSPTITGNTITNNTALHGGGGIGCYYSSTPTITGNKINGNTATNGGGAIGCYYSSAATIKGNTMAENSAYQGGAVFCYTSDAVISSNTLTANKATSTDGGGISCYRCSPTISNNTIKKNIAKVSGGGIACEVDSLPNIMNNVIADNTASKFGGSIYCYFGSSPIIANNTIVGNTASSDGGGIGCVERSGASIVNNIIAFCSSGVYSYNSSAYMQTNCLYSNGAYDYSGITNPVRDILADPMLVDRVGGNYHIIPTSPCINAGSNGVVGEGWKDLDNQARISGETVDIGADEYRPLAPENLSLAPSSGGIAVGVKTTFTSKYSDNEGYANLANCYLLLNTTLSQTNAVFVRYDANTNKLYVKNDANTTWGEGAAPGSSVVLENSYCRLYCSETTIVRRETYLDVNWRIEFKSTMANKSCKAWMLVYDNANTRDGWDQMGAFTIQ
ncbi:MAG: M6 family metalloprotease domain-containing protein [Armatimonadetes bacterium]|nr:M6 family metalloprotease domain-containing protein [Armatimonadota bacterium]